MTKIEAARAEYKEWCQAVGIDTLEKVNETLEAGKGIELINTRRPPTRSSGSGTAAAS